MEAGATQCYTEFSTSIIDTTHFLCFLFLRIKIHSDNPVKDKRGTWKAFIMSLSKANIHFSYRMLTC